MRILHLVYDYPQNPWVGGGGAVRVHEICRRLAMSGHEVTVLSGRFPGAKGYREGNLQYEFVGSTASYGFSTFSYALGAAEFVRKKGGRFDIVIEDFAPWNPVFVPFWTRRPSVLHVNHREGVGILKRWFLLGVPFFLIEKIYPYFFRHVTALSEETRNKIRRSDAVIVPPGIEGGLLQGDYLQGIRQGKRIILYVGRLHMKNKGLDTLMLALRDLSGIKLRLIGRGKDEYKLKRMAEACSNSAVEFSGYLSEKAKIDAIKDADVLILPSRFEGWGIVVLEAAACGRPVIVSDIPELKYAVDAGFAISFKTGDAKDLAHKVNYLLNEESLRRVMGRQGREYAKKFTWERIAGEYEQYLLGIIKASQNKE